MGTTFTENDVGKPVTDTDGTAVGIVTGVEGNVAYVEPDPDVTDSIRAALGWKSDPEETIAVDGGSVYEITEDSIVLEGRHSSDGSGDTGHSRVTERDEGVGQRDVGDETEGIGGPDTETTNTQNRNTAEGGPDAEDWPPHGDRTVTDERMRDDSG